MDIKSIVRPSVLSCAKYIPGKPVEEVRDELGLEDIIKMASNENPLGASPKAMEAMIKELTTNANRYPESRCVQLVKALSQHHQMPEDHIIVNNGLDAVITTIGMTFINLGDEVIFGNQTFPAYRNITNKMGGSCVEVALNESFELDLQAFANAITPKSKLIFVCNPNNPTGTMNTAAQVEQLIRQTPENVLIVLDEAYFDFADSAEYPNSIPMVKDHPNVIVLRTFSKIMGLAAVRCGYAIANPEIIAAIDKVREPFPVNRIAQAGALASLQDMEFYQKVVVLNREGRSQYYDAFDELGLAYAHSHTNFVYVELPEGVSAQTVFQTMLRDGVIIRPQSSAGKRDALRITIGTTVENTRTILSLKRALGK